MQTSENLLWLIALPLFSSAILLLAGKPCLTPRLTLSWRHVEGLQLRIGKSATPLESAARIHRCTSRT